MPAEPVKPELPVAETTPANQPASAETAATDENVNSLAAVAETSPTMAAAPTAAEPAVEVLSLEGNGAATRIATLGSLAVTIETAAPVRTATAKQDRSVKRKQAQRARERRRLAARRALLARQAAQQQADPFSQTPTLRAKP